MDWFASVFYYPYPAYNLMPAVLWTTFVFTTAFTLIVRRMAWAAAAFWAGLIVLAFFSVMLTLYNGVRSTAAIGGMFMIAYVSIVAFPTAGIVRVVTSLVRRLRQPPRPTQPG